MTKKKSFLSLVLAFAIMLPCMFFMTACGGDSDSSGAGGEMGGSGGSGSIGETGGSGGTGGSGSGSGVSAVQAIKENIGNNFEITISGGIMDEVVIRTPEGCYSGISLGESLFYNGDEYYRPNSEEDFYFEKSINNFNLDNITWSKTTLGSTILLYATSIDFNPLYGWSSSATTYLDRPMTMYTNETRGNVYIDNATGAAFKVELIGAEGMGNFEVTSFSTGSASILEFINAIVILEE